MDILEMVKNDKNINETFRNALPNQKSEKKNGMDEYVSLLRKFLEMADELSGIKSRLYELNIENSYSELSKAKAMIMCDIQRKYGKENVIDCFGDLFVINKEKTIYNIYKGIHENTYFGKRVLLNENLSEEVYEIQEVNIFDCDDEYDFTDYEIKLLNKEGEN